MKSSAVSIITLSLLSCTFLSSISFADFHRHWRETPPLAFRVRDPALWRGGHWYHGPYAGRSGWWWIVGNTWHYYPRAYYPYPDPGMTPVYIVESPAPAPVATVTFVAPPPPPAPAPVVVTSPAPAPVTASAEPIQMMNAPQSPAAAQAPIQMQSASPAGAQFYYCSNPRGYYPTVQSCPSGWAASPAPAPQ